MDLPNVRGEHETKYLKPPSKVYQLDPKGWCIDSYANIWKVQISHFFRAKVLDDYLGDFLASQTL